MTENVCLGAGFVVEQRPVNSFNNRLSPSLFLNRRFQMALEYMMSLCVKPMKVLNERMCVLPRVCPILVRIYMCLNPF